MKKILSALTALAFTGAYAATLTVGGQIQAGVKVKGGNHNEDVKAEYYLDGGDTKIFLKYKDEAKGISGVLVGAFDGAAMKSDNGTESALFKAKEAWIKFDLFRSGGASAYMVLGLQPNLIKVCDISITDVYGPDKDYTLVAPAVTLGVALGGVKLQSSLVNPSPNKGLYSLAEVAAVISTEYANVALALDMVPGELGNDEDDRWLAYGYANIKAIEPVNVEAQASYGKYSNVDNSAIAEVAVKVSTKNTFKVITKSAKPYAQVEYVDADKVSGRYMSKKQNYYVDRQFAIKVGTVIKYNKHLTENGYIKYIATKYAPTNANQKEYEKTKLEVGGEFTLKFAKSISLD